MKRTLKKYLKPDFWNKDIMTNLSYNFSVLKNLYPDMLLILSAESR